MWRILLSFAVHRLFLLGVVFVSINGNLPATRAAGALPEIHSWPEISNRFVQKVAELPEVSSVARYSEMSFSMLFSTASDPFLWICAAASKLFGISAVVSALLFSNLFFLLFLAELYALLNRLVTPDVALPAVILTLMWPASYEMSLGSQGALVALLTVMTLRHVLDTSWLFAGLSLGLLALGEPLSLGLLPLLLYIFWYFQRHFGLVASLQKGVALFLPWVAVVIWRWPMYADIGSVVSASALMNLISTAQGKFPLQWTFSDSNLGQTISLLILGIGAVSALFSYTMVMHRVLPLTIWLVLLAFTPYPAIASKALIAAVCLEGVVSLSSMGVLRVLQVILLGLSAHEIFTIFA